MVGHAFAVAALSLLWMRTPDFDPTAWLITVFATRRTGAAQHDPLPVTFALGAWVVRSSCLDGRM